MSAEFNTDLIVKQNYFSGQTSGIIVEVGAAGPDVLSFSKMFRDQGWRCISIEPNPYFVKMHKDLGNEIYLYACADYDQDDADFYINGENYNNDAYSYSAIKIRYDGGPISPKVIKTKIRKLDYILEKEAYLEEKIDILIIDVEGWELEVMKGFDHIKYSPKIIVLENYLHDQKYNQYMNSVGFELMENIEYNYIFKNKNR